MPRVARAEKRRGREGPPARTHRDYWALPQPLSDCSQSSTGRRRPGSGARGSRGARGRGARGNGKLTAWFRTRPAVQCSFFRSAAARRPSHHHASSNPTPSGGISSPIKTPITTSAAVGCLTGSTWFRARHGRRAAGRRNERRRVAGSRRAAHRIGPGPSTHSRSPAMPATARSRRATGAPGRPQAGRPRSPARSDAPSARARRVAGSRQAPGRDVRPARSG